MILEEDKRFLTKIAMPFFGIKAVYLSTSDSKKSYPDIWVEMNRIPVITVTREWARQSKDERRKRIVHELLHIKGLNHGRYGNLVYSTYPAQDTLSRFVYQRIMSGHPRDRESDLVLGSILRNNPYIRFSPEKTGLICSLILLGEPDREHWPEALAHEIGHYKLRHLKSYEKTSEVDSEVDAWDFALNNALIKGTLKDFDKNYIRDCLSTYYYWWIRNDESVAKHMKKRLDILFKKYWGHDFIPDYASMKRLIDAKKKSMKVLEKHHGPAPNPEKTNVVYGISRWTNASRPSARHIDDGTGKPLCGGQGRKVFSWQRDFDYPTCEKCIRISNQRGFKNPISGYRIINGILYRICGIEDTKEEANEHAQKMRDKGLRARVIPKYNQWHSRVFVHYMVYVENK